MKYISIGEIVECNALLKAKRLNFRIHLRDACGKQSCWIEPLVDFEGEECWEKMYRELETFFNNLGYNLIFDKDNLNFWLDQTK